MDELKAFYNNPHGPKRILLKGPQTNGIIMSRQDISSRLNKIESHRISQVPHGTDYAEEIQKKELEHYLQVQQVRGQMLKPTDNLDSMEQLSSIGTSMPNLQLTEETTMEHYPNYSKKREPEYYEINDHKSKIMQTIAAEQVVIIEGPTGCGKTTQVPQWILDDCYEKRKQCNIVVTQPRRIAAISIAKRVAHERGWTVGDLVGYQVGLENRTSTNTRLKYVTTGVLLQKLVATQSMLEYTHVIVDEVHERGQEMDFLLLVVKKLLFTSLSDVKVILMSATFNVQTFSEYFKVPTDRGFESTICVSVMKKNTPMYTVKTFYLDQLNFKNLSVQAIKQEEPSVNPDLHKVVVNLLNTFEVIDKQEDHYEDITSAELPSVLIFLPGINEIEELFIYLQQANAGKSCKWWLLPLHSTITADEQAQVFSRAPPGHRKVILSTNIAESSITVPDIKYVIDFCLMKVLVADDQTNFTCLQLQWASKTNCEQRAGRAGRVRDGRVYRLVRTEFYKFFSQECPPEIRRCPLERLVLLAKMLHMGSPKEILGLAMNPPDMSNIHRTIFVLKEIGALKKTLDGVLCIEDGDITYLGRLMAKLPVDVRVAKLIMLGHIYGCLDEAVVMGSAMTVKNVFSNPFQERLNAYNSKLTWADGSTSDCIAFLNVYKVWNHLKQQQYFKQRENSEREWARRFYIQIRALRELDAMNRELNRRLSREGLEPLKGKTPWTKNELPLILKVILAGAFYPHYFVQSAGDEAREREATKILGGLDPRYTVYLKDFPSEQPGAVYATSIKNIIKKYTGDEPRVIFDHNSCKVYLSFSDSRRTSSKALKEQNTRDPTMPGKVVLPVYKAVKIRQLRIDVRLALLPQEKALVLAQALELDNKLNINSNQLIPKLPDIDDSHFPLKISQFINCGRFWAQSNDESTASDLEVIQKSLNERPLLAPTLTPRAGDLYAAPYQDENGTKFYRACVYKLMPNDMVWVFYVDYGSSGRVNVCSLRELPQGLCRELQPLAVECSLAEVAPSMLLDVHGQWTQQATNRFRDLVSRGGLIGKVYSVAHGVVSMDLLIEGGAVSVNKDLVERGLAQHAEESYESKMNRDLRATASDLNLAQKRAYNKQQHDDAFRELRENDPPSPRDCVADVHLKGPFSPLESTVYPLLYGSRNKLVGIEWNSVNAVLLDTEPQEIYERLLVAGCVGQNSSGERLTLRHTTLMPHIPGLPAMITMLFCPTMELRRDDSLMRYVCALCGLGCDDTGRPLFPEHDMLVNIDVDLTIEDIGTINHVRHLMDYMMFCHEGHDGPNVDDELRPQVPTLIRQNLVKLLWRQRKHREGYTVPDAWEWRSVPEDDLLEIEDAAMLERAVMYPLHTPLELRPADQDTLLALKDANDLLKIEVARTPVSSNKEVTCTLCETGAMATQAMRIHLLSRAHRDREEDFRMFQS